MLNAPLSPFNTLYGSFLVEAEEYPALHIIIPPSFNTLYGSFLVEALMVKVSEVRLVLAFNTLYGSFLVEAQQIRLARRLSEHFQYPLRVVPG